MNHRLKMMLAFEGADRTGKTHIAAEIERLFDVKVFKNKSEWAADLKSPIYFKNLLQFGGTLLVDFLAQVRPNCVLDRFYASEWVYSKAFSRATDDALLEKIDQRFADAGGVFVVCRRRSFAGLRDDLHDYIDSEKLTQIDSLYGDFVKWTKCRTLTVWVDDEDLERETIEIANFLWEINRQ